ncbi:Alpha/Beta hydrolase protein [Lasiosphaeria hispida]|uniref:Alpha/Beta hydrolase protein n=1 Tax=Lasiosphaeria hispida TaxID=260671 RepID=A0AAJ0HUW7_9PEZI|nr:Alpha/Beta hydrolase protein [Lasiosphaeria hispida]
MELIGFSIALFLAGAALARASPSPRSTQERCSRVAFKKLPATAQNVAFTHPPSPNNVTEILDFLAQSVREGVETNGTQTVSGEFTINGVYCKPTGHHKDRNTLQLLVHGITYNSTMWGGYGLDDRYNWHKYANADGYHTLAIDRLGQGLNTRTLDPLNVIQPALHVEAIHQLITAVRTDSPKNALDRGFNKIAYVGHSFGSMIGTSIALNHPGDATALVLTGYSTTIDFRVIQSIHLEPAAAHSPARFPGVAPGYVVFASESERESAFYGGAYDPDVAQHDFAYEDVLTAGEFAAQAVLFQPAVGYTGNVLAVTGADDIIFCPLGGVASCETILRETGDAFYPNASSFEVYAPADTGHDLTLHYSVPTTLAKVHQFLGKHF